MVLYGVDYAVPRFTGAELANPRLRNVDGHAVKFACRYLRNAGTIDKEISIKEARDLIAHVDLVSNDETTGVQYQGGFDGGARSAEASWAVHKAIGGPDNAAIYFSPIDHDTSGWGPAEWRLLERFLQGAASVITLGRVGFYQGYRPVKWAFDNGLCTFGWQTRAWSKFADRPGGPQFLHWDLRAHLQQYGGGWPEQVDFDRAEIYPFGSWKSGLIPKIQSPQGGTPKRKDRGMRHLVRKTGDAAVFEVVDGNLLHIDTENIKAFAEIDGCTESAMRNSIVDVPPDDPFWDRPPTPSV